MTAARARLPAERPAAPDGADATGSPWKPFADRRRDRLQKKEAVVRAAATLFLELGYDRASLNEIAQRLNITKPALYNYFRGKDEILLECYRIGWERVDATMASVGATSEPGLEKVRGFIRAYALIMTEEFGMCMVRMDERVLAPDDRLTVREAKRRIDHGFRGFLAAGIEDGSVRACDSRMIAFVVFGALNGIGRWFDRAGQLDPDTIAAGFADELTAGLAGPVRARRRGRRRPEGEHTDIR